MEDTAQRMPQARSLGLYKVRFLVGDVQHSLKFYQTFLGLRLAWIEDNNSRRPLAACLELRDTELVLVEGRTLQAPRELPPSRGVVLCIEVADIALWFARAQQYGYEPLHTATHELLYKPQTQPWGEVSFALLDPDGYEIQVGQLL